ncbi:MAG: hypothetical protein IKA22_07965 [Lentisphaeria bacterium]|nr:hypothetical protein [Lentisphaeria bacterium]
MVKKLIIAVILIVAAAAVYFVFFSESEEQKIRKMLNGLCMDCAKNKESSSAAALIVKTNVLKSYFTDPCTLSVYRGFLQGTFNDVRIANEIMRVNLFFRESDLSYSDLIVTVNVPEATASFTGRFQAVLKSGERVDEVREVDLKLRKVEKKWKITSAEVHKILQR